MNLLPKRKYRRKGEFITENIVFADKNKTNTKSDPTAEIIVSETEHYRQRPILRAPFPFELRRAAINASDDNLAYTMILTRLLWDFHIIGYNLHSKNLILQFNTENLMKEVMDRVTDIKRVFDDKEKAWFFRELMLIAKTNQYDRDNPVLNRLFGDSSIMSALVEESSFLQNEGKYGTENHKELLRQLYHEDIKYTQKKVDPAQKARERSEYFKAISAAKRMPTKQFKSILKGPGDWEWNPAIGEVVDGKFKINESKLIQKFLERFVGISFYGLAQRDLEEAKHYAYDTANKIYEHITRKKVSTLLDDEYTRQQVSKGLEHGDIVIKNNQLPKKEYISKPALAMALYFLRIGDESNFKNRVMSTYNTQGGQTQLVLGLLFDKIGQEIKQKAGDLKLSEKNENVFYTKVITYDDYKFDENFEKILQLVMPKSTLFGSGADTDDNGQIEDIKEKAHIKQMTFLDYWRLINDTAYYYRIDYNVVFDYLQQKILPKELAKTEKIAITAQRQKENAEKAKQAAIAKGQAPKDNTKSEENNNNDVEGDVPLSNNDISFNQADYERQASKFTPTEIKNTKDLIVQQTNLLKQNGSANFNEMSEEQFIKAIHDTYKSVPLDYIQTLDSTGIQDLWIDAEEKWGDRHYYSADKKTRIIDKDKNYRANRLFNAYIDKIVSNPIGAPLAKAKDYHNQVFDNIKKGIEENLKKSEESIEIDGDDGFYRQCFDIIRWGKRLATWIGERIEKGYSVGAIVQAIRAANALDERLRYGKYLGAWNWFSFQNAFDYFYKQNFVNYVDEQDAASKPKESSKYFTVGDLKKCLNRYAQAHARRTVTSRKGLLYSQDVAVERLREIRDIIESETGSNEFTIQNFIAYLRRHDPDALKNFYKYGIADSDVNIEAMPEYKSSKGEIKRIPWTKKEFVTWDSFANWEKFNNYLFQPDMISFIYYDVIQPRERSRVYNTTRGGQLWFYYRRATLERARLENEAAKWANDKKGAVEDKIKEYDKEITSYDKYANTDEIKSDDEGTKKYKNGFSEKVNLIARLVVAQIKELGLSKVGWQMVFSALRQCGDPNTKSTGTAEPKKPKKAKKTKKNKASDTENSETEETENPEPATTLDELRKVIADAEAAIKEDESIDPDSPDAAAQAEIQQKYKSKGTRREDLRNYLTQVIGINISKEEAEYIIVVATAILSKERCERERQEYADLLQGSEREQQLRLEEFKKTYDPKLRIRIESLKNQQRRWTNEMGEHLKACKRRIEKNKFFLSRLIESRGIPMTGSEKEMAKEYAKKIPPIIKTIEEENQLIREILFVYLPKTDFDPKKYENISVDDVEDIKDTIFKKVGTDTKGARHNKFLQLLDQYKEFVKQFKNVNEEIKKVYGTTSDQNEADDSEKTSYDEFAELLETSYNNWHENKKADRKVSEFSEFVQQLIRLIQTIPANDDFIEELETYQKQLEKGEKLSVEGLVSAFKDSITTFKTEMAKMNVERSLDEVAANSVISGQNAHAMYDYMLKCMSESMTGISGGYDAGTSFIFHVDHLYRDDEITPNDEFIEFNEGERLSRHIKAYCALCSNEALDLALPFFNIENASTKKPVDVINEMLKQLQQSSREEREDFFRKIEEKAESESKIQVTIYSLNTEEGEKKFKAVFNNSVKANNETGAAMEKGDTDQDKSRIVATDNNSPDSLVMAEEDETQGVIVTILYPKEYTILHSFLNGKKKSGIFGIINSAISYDVLGKRKTNLHCRLDPTKISPDAIKSKEIGGSHTEYSDQTYIDALEKFTSIIARGRTFPLLTDQTEREGQWYWLTHNFHKAANAEKFKYWMVWFLVKKLDSPEKTKKALDRFCENLTRSLKEDYLNPVIRDGNYIDNRELIARYGTKAEKEGLKEMEEDENLKGWKGLVVRHLDLSKNEKEYDEFLEQTGKKRLINTTGEEAFKKTFEEAEVVEIKYPLCWFQMYDDLSKDDLNIRIRTMLSTYSKQKLTLFDFDQLGSEEGKAEDIADAFGNVYGHIETFSTEITFEEYIKQISGLTLNDLKEAAALKNYDINDFVGWNGRNEIPQRTFVKQ